MNYVKYWKFYGQFYLLVCLLLVFVFPWIYVQVLSIFNIVTVAGIIIIAFAYYALHESKEEEKELISQYNFRYLFVKLIEVFLQQLFILAIISLSNQNMLITVLIFAVIHIHLFFYKSLLSSVIFTTSAIALSFIFYLIYTSMGTYGLGLAYAFHMFLYLIGGEIFARIYHRGVST